MEKKLEYFLRVAQELNITKVAREFYISQQGLSFQIRKLEEEYGVVLFKRSPRLSLTPAGETLLRTVQRINLLEGNLKAELQEISQENKGLIKVGIISSRSEVVFPEVLDRYWSQYPQVSIDTINGVTNDFEKKLLNEELDCFISINPISRPEFTIVPLYSDDFYIVISDTLLQKFFPDEYPGCINRFSLGVDLHEFRTIPIILPAKSSRLFAPMRMHLSQNNFVLNSRLTTNNGVLRFEMAARGWGAAIATRSRIKTISSLNKKFTQDRQLYIFPINSMKNENSISLTYNKFTFQPKYLTAFINTVISTYREEFPEKH